MADEIVHGLVGRFLEDSWCGLDFRRVAGTAPVVTGTTEVSDINCRECLAKMAEHHLSIPDSFDGLFTSAMEPMLRQVFRDSLFPKMLTTTHKVGEGGLLWQQKGK